jgi:hypothetical protein
VLLVWPETSPRPSADFESAVDDADTSARL